MIDRKKYKVFEKVKENFAVLNPELSFIVAGLDFPNSGGVYLDTIMRYVVYFYDRNCEVHATHTSISKARNEALLKFKILRSVSDSDTFIIVESEMALRYMMWNRDNEMSVFISTSFQLENLNHRIRTITGSSTMGDVIKSLDITKQIFDLSEQIDTRRASLFGDMEHIEKYAIQKEIDNKYKCETAMLG